MQPVENRGTSDTGLLPASRIGSGSASRNRSPTLPREILFPCQDQPRVALIHASPRCCLPPCCELPPAAHTSGLQRQPPCRSTRGRRQAASNHHYWQRETASVASTLNPTPELHLTRVGTNEVEVTRPCHFHRPFSPLIFFIKKSSSLHKTPAALLSLR